MSKEPKKMKIDDLFEIAKKGAKSAKNIASGTYDALKGVSEEKVLEIVENFNKILPILEDAGFVFIQFDVEFGIPLGVVTHFKFDELIINKENIERLIEKNKEVKMASTLLNSLYQTYLYQSKIKITKKKFKRAEIGLGLPPSVKIVFK